MRPIRRITFITLVMLVSGIIGKCVLAQDASNYVELRGAGNEAGWYRYAEYNYTFRAGPMIDIVHLGVPGQNELYLGAGYSLQPTRSLTVIPLLYAVVGKERGQRGVSLGAFVLGNIQGWNLYSFLGYFEPTAGDVPRYLFLDSLDVSRKLKQWELGGSAGLFYTAGQWSSLVGPVLIHNDSSGSWRFSIRGGSSVEVKLARTFSF